MAVLVDNSAIIDFGDLAAGASAVTISHIWGRVGTATLFVKALTTPRTIGPGEAMEVAIGDLDLKFNSGDMTDAGYQALLQRAMTTSNTITLDALTSSNTTDVVSETGYAQVAWGGFTFATGTDTP